MSKRTRPIKQTRQKSFLKDNWLAVGIVLMLGFVFLVFQANSGTSASLAELEQSLTSGQPTVLEVYSDT